MITVCLALVFVALALCLPASVYLLRASRRWGLVDRPGLEPHKRDPRGVPNIGGIAIFWSIAAPMAACMIGVWVLPYEWWEARLPAVAVHLNGLRATTSIGGGVLTGLAVLHLMGLYDDRRSLGPWTKLAVQAVVAAGLVLLCDMRVLSFLGERYAWGEAASMAASLVWIVVIINAFNFLDNMDGLAGGVAAVCAGLYLASTLIGGQWFVAALSALLLGALLGFLVFNFPPAKLFMGDGGSLVVGLMLAVISIRTTYFDSHALQTPGHWYGVLMPLMVLAVPLYDFASVVLLRAARGQNPMRGDHNHFSHRLVRLGMSKAQAVMIVLMCTLATGLAGVMLGSLDRWQAILAGGQTLAVLTLLALLEGSARERW